MPASDFFKCKIYEQIEPFGDRRSDLLTGIICSLIANVNRDPKSKPYTAEQFMPQWDKEQPRKPSSEDDIRAFMMALKEIQNARVARA